ncbi:hypothetical protein [Lichenifustis flavocetrariae]|uniref:VPLPA-CTERM sorting domain-containing protein n=1 Tax=Lichenifustis flavocetrariae TaxID=2949735 RepID=A0AA41Z4W3_9HYPH|nr:hypothetical protein [Lichenifustis flavocetrariae]MCW6510345.1 hypothetical protein [Lichenifustis flavocetrariae]
MTLTPGTTALDGGAVNLTLSIVPAGGGSEWLVFDYTTANGGPLASYNANWTINQVGLDAAVPVNFIAAFSKFSVNGTAQTPSYSFFGGYSVEADPVPGGTGMGLGVGGFVAPLGSGPLGGLGAFINPWGSYLSSAGIDPNAVNGYEQALEFSPVTLSAVPLPASLPLFGTALLGFGAVRYGMRRRGKAATA